MFWLWLLLGSLPSVRSFSFTTSPPTECDALRLAWDGGSPPFSFFLYPLFGSPRNISIPASAWDDGGKQGSFSFTLNIASSKQFVITMSDSTGFATGGSTPVLTTGPSIGKGSCSTVDPGVAFPFELNTALQQCRPYIFSGYTGAAQPVTIIGTVPGGTSFVLNPPVGPTTFIWEANIASGTSVIFSMLDSLGRNGGTSDLKTVGVTSDGSCLNYQSPSSTTSRPATSTRSPTTQRKPTSSSTTSPSASSTPAPGGPSPAAIAGTVVGSLLFLAVIVTLGFFFLRKRLDRRNKNQSEVDLTYDPSRQGGPYPYPSVAAAASTTPLQYIPPGAPYGSNPFLDSHSTSPLQAFPNPYLNTTPSPASPYPPSTPYTDTPHYQQLPSQQPQSSSHQPQPQYQQPLPLPSQSGLISADADPFNPYNLHNPPPPEAVIRPFNVHNSDDSGSMTSTQRKAAMAGLSGYTPSRFIMHTDVEDELPLPNSDGIVELPPQYTERRAPPLQTSSSVRGSQQSPS